MKITATHTSTVTIARVVTADGNWNPRFFFSAGAAASSGGAGVAVVASASPWTAVSGSSVLTACPGCGQSTGSRTIGQVMQ